MTLKPKDLPNRLKITVCASCLRAACWQGIFFCDDYLNADVADLPVKTLRRLKTENPSYWLNDPRVKEWEQR